ncbi:hypothetical protein CBR_g88108, partial [Chara braunii]
GSVKLHAAAVARRIEIVTPLRPALTANAYYGYFPRPCVFNIVTADGSLEVPRTGAAITHAGGRSVATTRTAERVQSVAMGRAVQGSAASTRIARTTGGLVLAEGDSAFSTNR